MEDYILLLRGVNVGGTGTLPMAALRSLLTGLGARDVATYIQSGNAVFRGDFAPAALADEIETAIEAAHGFRPAALVLTAERLAAVHAGFPFAAARQDPKTGHIWFLARAPTAVDRDAISALAGPDERWALAPGAFYLHAPSGIGRSKLAARVERLLGVPATARNLNTVNRLVAMAARG